MPSRNRLTLTLLFLLTLIAGALRFTALDKPSVWGDEGNTYGRVAGTYQDLLNQLSDAVFPPLHYELEWWIAQGMPYWGTLAPPVGDSLLEPQAPLSNKQTRPGKNRPVRIRFVALITGQPFQLIVAQPCAGT